MLHDFEIRTARVGDAASLAIAWREFGRDYVELDADEFRVPDPEGLVAWFEARLNTELTDEATWLVAEREERLIGFVQAQMWHPADDANRQLLREVAEPILKVNSLMVLGDTRKAGVGTALMRAVEHWGAEKGATSALVIASLASAAAVAFYEDRMGYERKTVGFSKSL